MQRLASSFRSLLDGLMRASPAGERSRIVLLTPGPHNETYFEQVFLARYLGVSLVEGSDLTVRDQRLYLKTLHGLERVHVLLRRVDDEFLDPLELRPDSQLGVPGLLQVMRAGNVMVFIAPDTEAEVLRRLAAHLKPDGFIATGFHINRELTLADFDTAATEAGLTVDQRFDTWDLKRLHDPDFAVTILRHTPTTD